jgi:enediyne biosynthesis protein E4
MVPAQRTVGLLLGLSLGLSGCWSVQSPQAPSPDEGSGPAWFEDVTEPVGLDFIHDPGPTGTYFMPQWAGSGCAFIPDGDGTLYLYLLQNAGPKSSSVNRLYKRLNSGKLQDVTAGSGLDVAGYNMGVAVGDVNNDGLPDVLLTQYGGIRLFRQRGNGRFEDVTAESGLRNTLWGASAAFLDYDRDGWLDLIIVNYLAYDPTKETCVAPDGHEDFCGPNIMSGTCSKLFHNRGAASGGGGPPFGGGQKGGGAPRSPVRFEDVSFASGIGRLAGPGLGVACADFDGDGWPDIFIANDGKPNHLWINQKDGTFVNEAVSRGVA